MALVAPEHAAPLEEADGFVVRAGGAESNVAIHLARLGVRSRWVGCVGDDPLGRRIVAEIAAAGVDVAAVAVDPQARTGVYFKDPGADPGGASTRVHYYRDGSAASRMDPTLLDDPRVTDARVLHVSGITAALSPSCAALLRAVVAVPRGPLVSFDVNHRPGLWRAATAGPVLAELADASDLVFVGQDEAERLWGLTSAAAVRERLPGPATIVVKDGATGATHLDADGNTTWVPALRVEVAEPVGAGDAFAAGFLAALLDDLGVEAQLRCGHLVAAQVLGTTADHGPLPRWAWFQERASVDDATWQALDGS